MASDYDVIVIGAGHNGLVCGAYLAQAGERVLVVERYEQPGGCVATACIPGYPELQVDIGGLEHGVFANSHAMQELRLADFDLRYLQRDHTYTFPFTDGTSWFIHKDCERTQSSIAAISPRDAEAFGRFSDFCSGVLALLSAVSDGPPPGIAELANLAGAGGQAGRKVMQTFLASPRQVVDSWFESEQIRAGLINYASHAQTPPWQLGSGYAPCLALGGQGSGGRRPEGSGRMLVRALVRCLAHHGGAIRCGVPVTRILVENRRAIGIELADGERITAGHAVISAIDARRVFTRLVDPVHLPPAFRHTMERLTSGRDNIGELSMACVLSELPRLTQNVAAEALHGCFWQSGFVQDVEDTFIDIRRGVVPSRPCVMWAAPSVLDPTLAPAGKHVLWLATFVPYALRDGRTWDDVKDEVADHLLATIGTAAPNLPSSVLARQVLSPLDWERRTDNICGNADHLDTSIDQMLGSRPSPALSRYRTPIRGLYLTGAGTHPGGGITGGPGRNTAREVMRDLGIVERESLKSLRERLARLKSLAGAAHTLRRYV